MSGAITGFDEGAPLPPEPEPEKFLLKGWNAMSMTHEERAEEVLHKLNLHDSINHGFRSIISTALRQVEREAYENAAAVAMVMRFGPTVVDGKGGGYMPEVNAPHIAQDILKLIPQEPA